jgi:hypothetical protein
MSKWRQCHGGSAKIKNNPRIQSLLVALSPSEKYKSIWIITPCWMTYKYVYMLYVILNRERETETCLDNIYYMKQPTRLAIVYMVESYLAAVWWYPKSIPHLAEHLPHFLVFGWGCTLS